MSTDRESSRHLNGVIDRFRRGETVFVVFSHPNVEDAIKLRNTDYDAVVVDIEHYPFSIRSLRDYFQYLLDRRSIAERGLAPAITPLVRIPPSGGELNQWIAKQVLDVGAYGIMWPHIETVEQARNAVAACQYPSPSTNGLGSRGYIPGGDAARYFGLTAEEYVSRAGLWPVDPSGEILVIIMIESVEGVKNIETILDGAPGVGAVMLGIGDLSVELGYPGQVGHPEVMSASMSISEACERRGVPCGAPISPGKTDSFLDHDFQFLVVQPELSYAPLARAREAVGRRSQGAHST